MQALPRPLRWPPIFPLQKGLVCWLPFDDRSGAEAYDRSGKENHGSLEGPTWVAGRRGSALSFDGVTHYVEVSDSPSLTVTAGVSMVVWANPSLTGDTDQFFICKGSDQYHFSLNKISGKLTFSMRDSGDVIRAIVSVVTVLTASIWQHVAVVYDGVNVHFYRNGVGETIAHLYGSLLGGGGDLEIGRHDWHEDYHFSGVLGEVRIYNQALNTAQIKRLSESELLLARL